MNEQDVPARRTAFIALVLVLYATSLVLPAAQAPMSQPGDMVKGYEAVMYGYGWPVTIPWAANLALIIGLLGFGARLYNLAIGAAALGMCLAWTSPMVVEMRLKDFGPGFHVWWITFVVLGAVSVAESLASRGRTEPSAPAG